LALAGAGGEMEALMNTRKLPNKQASTVRVWRPDPFVGLELKRGTTEAKPSALHMYEAYQISLITAGTTILCYRRSQQVAPAPSLMAIVSLLKSNRQLRATINPDNSQFSK